MGFSSYHSCPIAVSDRIRGGDVLVIFEPRMPVDTKENFSLMQARYAVRSGSGTLAIR